MLFASNKAMKSSLLTSMPLELAIMAVDLAMAIIIAERQVDDLLTQSKTLKKPHLY